MVNTHSPASRAAGLLTCGGLNLQLNAAASAYYSDVEEPDWDHKGSSAELGSALFWRDPSLAAAGVRVSYLPSHSEDAGNNPFDYTIDRSTLGAGAFAEYYASEVATLGVSVDRYAFDRDINSGGLTTRLDGDGWKVALRTKYYSGSALALSAKIGVDWDDYDVAVGQTLNVRTVTFTGQGEYLFPGTSLAIFGGAQYESGAERVDGAKVSDVDDIMVFAGFRYDFADVASLVERDRTGPILFETVP